MLDSGGPHPLVDGLRDDLADGGGGDRRLVRTGDMAMADPQGVGRATFTVRCNSDHQPAAQNRGGGGCPDWKRVGTVCSSAVDSTTGRPATSGFATTPSSEIDRRRAA